MALIAFVAYLRGDQTDPWPLFRVAVVVAICAVLLLIHSFSAAAWRKAAQYARSRESGRYKRDPAARVGGAKPADGDLIAHRCENLKLTLQQRHGPRWRYRDRWVVVAGEAPLVERLAPGLTESGYAITGDTILLYASETGDRVDPVWLEQIRRLRRRRPVDAVVALGRTQSANKQSFDIERTSRRLLQHARALSWTAPVYLLNMTDFGGETLDPDEAIGCTWSNARTRLEEVDGSLRDLSYDLADAGVVRLTKDATDRYPAELSKHIEQYGRARQSDRSVTYVA